MVESKGSGSTFRTKIDVVEWLGSEAFAYIPFEAPPEVQEQLAQLEKDLDGESLRTQLVISLDGTSKVAAGDDAEIWVDTSKMHLFDPATGENLTVDLAKAGRVPERMEAASEASGGRPSRRLDPQLTSSRATCLRSTETPPQIATPLIRTVGELASSCGRDQAGGSGVAAHDAGALDDHVRVRADDHRGAAHERVDGQHHLLGGELRVPQVQVGAAHQREDGQLLRHHPDALAVDAAEDREVPLLSVGAVGRWRTVAAAGRG